LPLPCFYNTGIATDTWVHDRIPDRRPRYAHGAQRDKLDPILVRLPAQARQREGCYSSGWEVRMSKPLFKPLSELHKHTAEIVAQLRRSHVPVVVTEEGQSTAVLLDVETYEGMLGRLKVPEGIARGEAAIAEGRVVSHEDARKRFSRWLDSK
jgi:prevent-host-death family protein